MVDDDEDLRDVVRAALGRAGIDTAEACHGADALALLRGALRPDVIVLDLQMPEMDGVTFLAALRRMPRAARPPVVVVTGQRPVELGSEQGVAAVLHKPFRLNELVATVQDLARARPDGSPEPS